MEMMAASKLMNQIPEMYNITNVIVLKITFFAILALSIYYCYHLPVSDWYQGHRGYQLKWMVVVTEMIYEKVYVIFTVVIVLNS